MLLTDRITDAHLKWLGEVVWYNDGAANRLLFTGDHWMILAWNQSGYVDDFIISCILEHAIREKLGINAPHMGKDGYYYSRLFDGKAESYEGAMITAIDILLAGEKDA